MGRAMAVGVPYRHAIPRKVIYDFELTRVPVRDDDIVACGPAGFRDEIERNEAGAVGRGIRQREAYIIRTRGPGRDLFSRCESRGAVT